MKKLLLVILITRLISCNESEKPENYYNVDELIFVVEMDSNEGKTVKEIEKFSQYYTCLLYTSDAADES